MTTQIFHNFVEAINAHNVDALALLMAPDHLFIDSIGNRVLGAVRMQSGWSGYFAMCPDYSIQVDTVLAENEIVLAVGSAGGTIDDTAWRTPTAWKALIQDGLVKQWQVFADNKPVYEILGKRKL